MPAYKDKTTTKWFYQFGYKNALGEYKVKKSRGYSTKREAEAAELKAKNKYKYEHQTDLTFNEVCDAFSAWKKDRLKATSYRAEQNKMAHIRKSLGKIQISELTSPQYQAFMENLEKAKLNPLYRNKVLQLCRQIVKFAEKRYNVTTRIPFIFDDYVVRGKNTMKLDFWTIEEYERFVRVVDDQVYKALYETLFFMGLRIGEANALLWEDIDFRKNTMSINKTVDTKMRSESGNYLVTEPKTTSSIRCLPMNKRVSTALKTLYTAQEKQKGFNQQWKVFGGKKSLSISGLQKKKKAYLQKANELLSAEGEEPLKEIRIHGFRHSCACFLINKTNANIAVISHYLGHSSTKETLDTYSSFYPSVLNGLPSIIDEALETG